MRILTIVKEMGPGGTERAAQNCTLLYRQHGHDVAILSTDKDGSRGEMLRSMGIPVWVGGYNQPAINAAVAQAVAWKPEFVHLHRPGLTDPPSAEVLRTLKRDADQRSQRLPVMETNHFARVDRSDDRLMIDLHIQLSTWCMWKWGQWARGLKPPSVSVVLPHIVDPKEFHPISAEERRAFRAKHNIPQGAFVFGRLGQPSGWSPTIFDAFTKFAPQSPDSVLVVVGLDDSLRPLIAQMPAEVQKRVIEIPFMYGDEQLRTCYASLDCFLHAKRIGESFGFVLTEAMLCGCPVITESTPLRDNSQLEVVGHERGGLVVTNSDTMLQAMHRMHDDAALRKKLGEGGRAWVIEQYAPDVVGPRLLKLIEIISQSRDRSEIDRRVRDAGFITDVPWNHLAALMKKQIGRTGLMTRSLLRLSHHPAVHPTVVRLKRALKLG